MRLRWPVVPLLLCACTRPNPLFGARDDDGSGSAESSATTPTSLGTSEGEVGTSRASAEETSLGSATASTSTSTGHPETSTETASSGESESTGSTCTVPEPVPVSIEIQPPQPIDANCETVWMSPQGPLSVADGTITIADCLCNCTSEPVPAATIAVEGVPIGALPACGHVVTWLMESELGCEWGGLAVFGGSQPSWIVSRTMFVPPEVFGGLMVARAPGEPCPNESCDTTGTYALQFVGAPGDNVIAMDEAPKVMTLPFFASLDYLVDDVTSVVDDACNDHTVWTAEYVE